MSEHRPPSLSEIRAARERLGQRIRETPVWQWRGDAIEKAAGADTGVFLKLELFQYAGSFKPRGALCVMMDLSAEQLARGVTAVSGGNHAVAVSYAARALGATAKVVMPKTANPACVELARGYGTEVELVETIHQAFERVREIEVAEGRAYVHPFEGAQTALGTATLGLELCAQVPDLDAVIIPIGGGGLCAGVSAAVKQLNPRCRVFGVEPEGADSMHRSFASGKPEAIEKVRTIATTLGAPRAEPYSFALCRQFVDGLVRITDDEIRAAMALMFRSAKLAVEPSGAAQLGPPKWWILFGPAPATFSRSGPVEGFRQVG